MSNNIYLSRLISIKRSLLLVIIFSLSFSLAYAEPTVGIITNMEGQITIENGNKGMLDFGDDVTFKDQISVGKNSSLVITYYAGCRQEWFGENTVIEIGLDKSKVINGQLQQAKIFDCEVPEVVLSDKDSFKKAAFHFRGVAIEKSSTNQQKVQKQKSKSKQININKNQTGDVKLRIWTAKKDNIYYRSGEHIIIYMVANKDAYLKLDYFQADGNVVHLIPNLFEEKQKIKAGQIYIVGGNKSKIKLIVENPYGEEYIRALVSTQPLDESFMSTEMIEESQNYQQTINKLLSKNKQAKVSEFELGIWSIP